MRNVALGNWIGLTLAGFTIVHWSNRAIEKQPQSAPDLAVNIGAPLIAGGLMMALISGVMMFTRG